MGVRVVKRHNALQMLSLQDARASLSQHELSGILTQFTTCIYAGNRRENPNHHKDMTWISMT